MPRRGLEWWQCVVLQKTVACCRKYLTLEIKTKTNKQGCGNTANVLLESSCTSQTTQREMRQLRKVAATRHGLLHQHLYSYHPETHKETYCCSAKTGLRRLYAEIQLQITDRAHTDINQDDPGRYQTG